MIQEGQGNLLEAGAEALVNTINTVGLMGKGIALQFKQAFSGNFTAYAQAVKNLVRGYGDSQKPDVEIGLLRGAVEEADAFLSSRPESRERLARVGNLIEGFETPYGMELLSSVHWVAERDIGVRSAADAANSIHAWNARKKQMFSSAHIDVAWTQLVSQGWILGTAATTIRG